MQEDAFETFILVKIGKVPPLDIYELMFLAQSTHVSIEDFWNTPLHIMLQALGVFQRPEKKPVSRKKLIDKEREMNRRWQQT